MIACLFVGGVADGRRIAIPASVLEWHIPKPLAPVMCDVRDERAFEEGYPVEIYRRVNARVFTSLPPGEVCPRVYACYRPDAVPLEEYRRVLVLVRQMMTCFGLSAGGKAADELTRLFNDQMKSQEGYNHMVRLLEQEQEQAEAGVPGAPPRCCPYCGRAEKVGQVLLACGACGGLACAECVARCCTPGCPEPRESFDPNQPNTETP